MPGFVGEREDVVEHVWLVVHQDVRPAVVRAGAERAAAFALIRVAIAPAAGEAFLEHAAVFAAERFERCQHNVDGLFPGVLRIELAENRHVGVVVMDIAQLHFLAADFQVLVDRRAACHGRRR